MIKRFISCVFFSMSFLVALTAFGQTNETLTMTTYYPSPMGVYQNLRLFPTATAPVTACNESNEVGTMYYDNVTNQVMVCRQTGTAPNTFAWGPVGGLWTLDGAAPNQFIRPNDINWNAGIGTNDPKAKLDVAGGVKIGNDPTCDSDKDGTLRYNNGIEYCNGSDWKKVGSPNIVTAKLTRDITYTRSDEIPEDTGVSATITATGNPIQIIVDVGAELSCASRTSIANNSDFMWMRVVRTPSGGGPGVVVGGGPEGKNAVAYAGHNYGGFTIIDQPLAGEYTYRVEWWVRNLVVDMCCLTFPFNCRPSGRIWAATGTGDRGTHHLNLYLIGY